MLRFWSHRTVWCDTSQKPSEEQGKTHGVRRSDERQYENSAYGMGSRKDKEPRKNLPANQSRKPNKLFEIEMRDRYKTQEKQRGVGGSTCNEGQRQSKTIKMKRGFRWRDAKRTRERHESSQACLFFFLLQSFHLNLGLCVSPGQPAVGIYSPMGRPANKTHVDLQRNGEGHGAWETASLCIPALTAHAHICSYTC